MSKNTERDYQVFSLRLDNSTYMKVREAAISDGVSMNTIILNSINESVPENFDSIFSKVTLGINEPITPHSPNYKKYTEDPITKSVEKIKNSLIFLEKEKKLLTEWVSLSIDTTFELNNMKNILEEFSKELIKIKSLENLEKNNGAEYLESSKKYTSPEEIKSDIKENIKQEKYLHHLIESIDKKLEVIRRRRGKSLVEAASFTRTEFKRAVLEIDGYVAQIDSSTP